MIRGHSLIVWARRVSSREALLGRMIPRAGVGLMRSVCVLAVLVVVDTGRLCKLALRAPMYLTTLNTHDMNFRVVWTKSTVSL